MSKRLRPLPDGRGLDRWHARQARLPSPAHVERFRYCGGPIVEKRVTLHRKVRGHYVLIENVPAGVCSRCGTRYDAANVLKTIEESIRGRRPVAREEQVPVYSLE